MILILCLLLTILVDVFALFSHLLKLLVLEMVKLLHKVEVWLMHYLRQTSNMKMSIRRLKLRLEWAELLEALYDLSQMVVDTLCGIEPIER